MKSDDLEFEDTIIKSVSPDYNEKGELTSWSFTKTDGWSFWVKAESGIEPHVGDSARFYGRGVGFTVRGLDINGKEVFYLTPEDEQKEHDKWVEESRQKHKDDFEQNKAKLDADFEALPSVFQRRITKFRVTNPDFRWEYEPYEMHVCRMAVAFANYMHNHPYESIEDSKLLDEIFPEINESSGNQVGCAKLLAKHYLTNPEIVVLEHGAMTPLTGCEDYGCPHPYEEKIDEISKT